MNETEVLDLLNYIRAHQTDQAAIRARLEQYGRAVEWAKQVQRWDLVVEVVAELCSYFVDLRPTHLKLADQDPEQTSGEAWKFWEQGKALATQGLLAAREVGDKEKELRFLGVLSRLSDYLGDFETALDYLGQEVRLVGADPGMKQRYAYAVHLYGIDAGRRENFSAARAYSLVALDILQGMDNKYGMADEVDAIILNETMRIEKSGAEIEKQLEEDLLAVLKSLAKLSDRLRREAELEQVASTDGESSSTTEKIDKEAVDSTYQCLRDTLAKLDSLT